MSDITIKKAKLTSGNGLSLELSERQKDNSYVDSKSEYSASVHHDLKESFRRLGVHLGLLSEYLDDDDVPDIDRPDTEIIKPFTVNSITFLPDDSGVSISGSIELSTGKRMSISPPAVKWDDEDGYAYSSELGEIAELAKSEIESYLKGKHAPEPQQQLPFGDGADAEDAR